MNYPTPPVDQSPRVAIGSDPVHAACGSAAQPRTTWTNSWGLDTYNADNSIAGDGPDPAHITHAYTQTQTGALLTDACSSYAYDGFDRLIAVRPTDAQSTACPTATYTYDALDRQASFKQGSTNQAFAYDGWGRATTTVLPSGASGISYELSPHGAPLGLVSGTQAEQLTSDGQGSVATVTNSVNGGLDCAVRYDPFGSPLFPASSSGTLNACNQGSSPNTDLYRSGRRDQATGDYGMGSRVYDPSKSAFLTPDTYRTGAPTANPSVGTDPLTANTYTYVNGDPVNLVDPSGHNPCRSEGTGDGGCTPSENASYARSDAGGSTFTPTEAQQYDQHRAATVAAVHGQSVVSAPWGHAAGLSQNSGSYADAVPFAGALLGFAISELSGSDIEALLSEQMDQLTADSLYGGFLQSKRTVLSAVLKVGSSRFNAIFVSGANPFIEGGRPIAPDAYIAGPPGPGVHAEEALLKYLQANPNARVLAFRTSNNICAPCAQKLQDQGGVGGTEGTRGWTDPRVKPQAVGDLYEKGGVTQENWGFGYDSPPGEPFGSIREAEPS